MTSSNVACPSRAVLTSGARRSDKEAGATMSGQCAWFMTDLATEPDHGAIHLSGTPAESITEAAECRSVCKPDRAWKARRESRQPRAHATYCVGRSARSARS